MNVSEVTEFVGSLEPFRKLGPAQISAICGKIHVSYCAEGNEPSIPADRWLLVRTGRILLLDERGNIIDILQRGDFHGVDSVSDISQKDWRLKCVEDSLIYTFSRSEFEKIIESNVILRTYFQQMKDRKLYKRQGQTSRLGMLEVGDLVKRSVISASPDCTIADAVEVMTRNNVSSLLVEERGKTVGILTDKDLRTRVMARGHDYSIAVSEVMTPNPSTISTDSFLFHALDTMCRNNIRHLPVVDVNGELSGMISATDLIQKFQADPVNLVADIHRQKCLDGLVGVSARMLDLVEYIEQIELPAYMASQVITTVTDALTQRLIEMQIEKSGSPPCSFSWIAFGSQARKEQALNADQDNALLIEEDVNGAIESYFKKLADYVCEGLNACGIPYCKGGIMASNEAHRLSMAAWKGVFGRLIRSPTPTAIMKAGIYFDSRCIHGSQILFNELYRETLALTCRNELFLHHLADAATKVKAPIGIFGKLQSGKQKTGEKGLNLKDRGLILITDLVRVYSLDAGISEVNTRDRLNVLERGDKGVTSLRSDECRDLLAAFDFLAQLRWDKHHLDLSNQRTPSNILNPESIPPLQRQQLKDVFHVIDKAQHGMRHRFCGEPL
ncbi:MAG: DUF294 nucleotidyltransferase-like domain-containing protein [Pseudohongiellaceae bacterium]